MRRNEQNKFFDTDKIDLVVGSIVLAILIFITIGYLFFQNNPWPAITLVVLYIAKVVHELSRGDIKGSILITALKRMTARIEWFITMGI